MSKVVASYRKNQIDGAQPAQILVLLFQTAVQRANIAIRACSPTQDAERGEAVRRVLDIVIELRSTLDKDAGGEVATNLDALYEFVISNFIDGHAARDPDKLKRALEVLDVLRDAFTQAAKMVEADPASAERAKMELEARRAEAPREEPRIVATVVKPAPRPPQLGHARPAALRRYDAY